MAHPARISSRRRPIAALACCLTWLLTPHLLLGGAEAGARRPPPRLAAPSLPDADAASLAALAPAARSSTRLRTYGDAPFARGRTRSRVDGARLAPRFSCASTTADARAIPCADAGASGRARGYTFNPAYVSSPLVDEGARSPLLPPVTALFWAADGLLNPPAP